jgi:hypothetical protein
MKVRVVCTRRLTLTLAPSTCSGQALSRKRAREFKRRDENGQSREAAAA